MFEQANFMNVVPSLGEGNPLAYLHLEPQSPADKLTCGDHLQPLLFICCSPRCSLNPAICASLECLNRHEHQGVMSYISIQSMKARLKAKLEEQNGQSQAFRRTTADYFAKLRRVFESYLAQKESQIIDSLHDECPPAAAHFLQDQFSRLTPAAVTALKKWASAPSHEFAARAGMLRAALQRLDDQFDLSMERLIKSQQLKDLLGLNLAEVQTEQTILRAAPQVDIDSPQRASVKFEKVDSSSGVSVESKEDTGRLDYGFRPEPPQLSQVMAFIQSELKRRIIGTQLIYKDSIRSHSLLKSLQGYEDTLFVIYATNNQVIGGYARTSWPKGDNSEYYKEDAEEKGFVYDFSNRRIYRMRSEYSNMALYYKVDDGPCFGDCLKVYRKTACLFQNFVYFTNLKAYVDNSRRCCMSFEIKSLEVYHLVLE